MPRIHGSRISSLVKAGGLALALVASLAPFAGAATYYVDNQNPAATDAGPGTQAIPHRTISAAVNQHGAAGNTILVSPGVYREQVSVNLSGAPGNPFVLRAVSPGTIVEGADDFSSTGQWTLVSGDVWLAAAVTWDPRQVFVDGPRLAASTLAPASIPAGSFRWVSGEGLYVNVGGGNPGAHDTQVGGNRNHGFTMFTKSWIVIDGFEVRHAPDRGIYLQTNCTDVAVRNNRVSFSGSYGIQAVGGTNLVIQDNVSSDNGLHGIGLTSGATNCVVNGNESFRNAHPTVRQANGIYLFGAPGNRLARNRLHHNQDTGLQMDGGSNNSLSVNNVSWANGDHGFDHLLSTGAVHIHDVAYENFRDGFSFENLATNGRLRNCISVNNGLTTNGADLIVDVMSTGGFSSDHDIIWNQNATTPIRFAGVQYSTLAAFRAATGNEEHGIAANPTLVDPANGNFRLQAGSPAIDAATSAPAGWPPLDAEGNSRVDDPATPNQGAGPVVFADIGAFEFASSGGPGPTAPVVSAPSVVNGDEAALIEIRVTASDLDGDPIQSLTADLSDLPSGHNASFTVNDTRTAGTLRWRPTYDDAGTYQVTFRAANDLSGTATTTINVMNVDRAPVVSAPNNLFVRPGGTVRYTVTASDPDGDPIQSLTMVDTRLPSGHGATFEVNGDHTSGVFTWNVGTNVGNFRVLFKASNALTGGAGTNLHVKSKGGPGGDAVAKKTGVEPTLPTELSLSAAYPNPSRDAVTFDLALPRDARVTWSVHDLQGRVVWSEERSFSAGRTQLRWDGMLAGGGRAPTGMYLARVQVEDVPLTSRFIRF